MLYMDNLEASVAVLTKLSDELREYSPKHPTLDPLRETLKSFRQKVGYFLFLIFVFAFVKGNVFYFGEIKP